MRVLAIKNTAAARARSILSNADLKYIIPEVAPEGASAGQLLKSFAALGTDDIGFLLKRIRKEIADELFEAKAPLLRVPIACDFLDACAAHIDNGSNLPDAPKGITSEFVASIKAARRYVKAGLIDKDDLTTRLMEAADNGRRAGADALKDLRKYESTATIIIAKQSANYARRSGREALATGYAKQLGRLTAHHRKTYGGK